MLAYTLLLLRISAALGLLIHSEAWGESNPDQYQLGQTQAAGVVIVKNTMIKNLDTRLQKLKSAESGQFTKEMRLQKEFMQNTESFCQIYYKLAENGSAAQMCTSLCYQYLYSFRSSQALSINKRSLDLRSNKKNTSYTKRTFNKFSHDLCNIMPSNIWKNRSMPQNCSTLVLQGIESSVSGLVYNPEDEGNICAVFGIPN